MRLRLRLLALFLVGMLMLSSATFTSAASPRYPSPSASPSGSNVVSFALSYVGYSYAYMGDTPSTGFSCTGFVHWVYSHFGYYTSEDTYVLYNSYPHIAASNMMPGDVLLFANTVYPGLSHAAIYIGNGKMVGADNFSVGVHVNYVWDSYWGPRFVTALRIAPYGLPSQDVQGFSYTNDDVTVHASSVRVHSGPGVDYTVSGSLPYGDRLTVITRTSGWVKVTTPQGLVGWVSSSYVW